VTSADVLPRWRKQYSIVRSSGIAAHDIQCDVNHDHFGAVRVALLRNGIAPGQKANSPQINPVNAVTSILRMR
jgi:hypothetical protein